MEGLREYIGADSLAYLSHEGMVAAVEGGDAPGNTSKHCTGCFNGVYPILHDASPSVTPAAGPPAKEGGGGGGGGGGKP